MIYHNLSFSITNHVGNVKLRRPPVNALNRELVAELTMLAQELHSLSDVWVVELSSDGKTFCAGADLKERLTIAEGDVAALVKNIQLMAVAWIEVPQPVIVGIPGPALGGGLELALAGDLLVASEDATLGFPEVGLGIIPAAGGTQRLAQRTSMGVAKKWILMARLYSAREAHEDGVIDSVVPAAAFEQELADLVGRVASNAPLALRQAKRALNDSYDQWLRRGLRGESDSYAPLIGTKDRREALEAFAEKRKPKWKAM